jgi:hypothetical protein
VTEGYGWGRLDLRQSLAPPAPVTFHAREDVVGPGGALDYEFTLPANTSLLRVTLAWDDPPGAAVRRALTLHVIPPGAAGQEHRGNVWNGTTSALVPATAPLGPVTVNVAQVILNNPRPGRYRVLVRAAAFGVVPELRLPAQPVALVFLGSGAPIPFTGFANVNVAGPLV